MTHSLKSSNQPPRLLKRKIMNTDGFWEIPCFVNTSEGCDMSSYLHNYSWRKKLFIDSSRSTAQGHNGLSLPPLSSKGNVWEDYRMKMRDWKPPLHLYTEERFLPLQGAVVKSLPASAGDTADRGFSKRRWRKANQTKTKQQQRKTHWQLLLFDTWRKEVSP